MDDDLKVAFPRRLPEARLGKRHDTLEAFRKATMHRPSRTKEYTLVVVTESRHPRSNNVNNKNDNDSNDDGTPASIRRGRILLGLKNRGFGRGMYNSFGGKFEDGETPEECACRELKEETNLCISLMEMKASKVGIQRYTFQEDPTEMVMHLYRIDLVGGRVYDIAGCQEITPRWFEEFSEVPLDNMFADDSLWLPLLLFSENPLNIDGWYHFREDCQATNTILHYCMTVQPTMTTKTTTTTTTTTGYSLEKRLFHALHDSRVHSPNIKEFKECYAFCNAVRSAFGKRSGGSSSSSSNNNKGSQTSFDVVIDVAGGHGALAALYLVCTPAKRAVVVDPASVGGGSVERAWSKFMGGDKELVYRRECLRTGLPGELKEALTWTSQDRILVVACHACSHLSEEILEISCRFGVNVAVMPCCQKDFSRGDSWKATSKNLSIPVAHVIDLLQCGKIMARGTHDVRMKCIDANITPQNRIIVCRALISDDDKMILDTQRRSKIDTSHTKLERAYKKAHAVPSLNAAKLLNQGRGINWGHFLSPALSCAAMGFLAGVVTTVAWQRR